MNEPVLEMAGVTFAYGERPAVEGVSLRIERGEFAAVVGPNGSGKSTLIRLALGLLRPQAGSVRLLDTPVERFREWTRVGYVPQLSSGVTGRFPITVAEVVAHGRYTGFDPLAIFRRAGGGEVREALEAVGAGHLAGRRIGELSVGQQQRVLVARGLVRWPDLLVLDEPIAGLDVGGEERIYGLLRRLNRERGMSILMVTHDIGTVLREASTVACINRTVSFHGAPHDLTQAELASLYGFPVEVLLHDALHEHR
jgi:zinc transport system ATP-binding protein